jgi:DnaJ-class molecular chaperone
MYFGMYVRNCLHCIDGHMLSVYSQIPAGTSSHTRIRLVGKGIARQSSYGNGDFYVHVKIKMPRRVNLFSH